jgi:hypothetical protein
MPTSSSSATARTWTRCRAAGRRTQPATGPCLCMCVCVALLAYSVAMSAGSLMRHLPRMHAHTVPPPGHAAWCPSPLHARHAVCGCLQPQSTIAPLDTPQVAVQVGHLLQGGGTVETTEHQERGAHLRAGAGARGLPFLQQLLHRCADHKTGVVVCVCACGPPRHACALSARGGQCSPCRSAPRAVLAIPCAVSCNTYTHTHVSDAVRACVCAQWWRT